jgi:hypothetical protein
MVQSCLYKSVVKSYKFGLFVFFLGIVKAKPIALTIEAASFICAPFDSPDEKSGYKRPHHFT